jgi:formylglycine-generating enzyme required for sulfatase activity
VAAVVVAVGSIAVAKVNIETVPVGNVGNTGEWSGGSYGGNGQDRICGAVDYEYNIGKYEVTAGQYCEFLNAVAGVDTYGLYNGDMWANHRGCKIQRSGSPGSYTYSVAGDWANRPVNYVSWGDAARFVNWLTNGQGNGSTETGAYNLSGATTRAQLLAVVVPTAAQRETWSNGVKPYFLLTSEDEWYKAAYYSGSGSTYYDYPTSSDSTPSNDLDLGGNNATLYDNGYTIGVPYWRTEVGAHENSDSPYGTFDQGGNVWEWNEAIPHSSVRGLRGGSFLDNDYDSRAPYRGFTNPMYEDRWLGFRVAQVPEPATLSLLALGGLAVLRRRLVTT